jgi:cytochrome d ubiquinol oxidase subunit II
VTLPEAVMVVMWVGVTFYALLGGADFGAGFWDLFAGGARKGYAQRQVIEHSIGPVWEANHVWLIFVVVVLWTAFPLAFASVMSTLIVPLTLAAFGVIMRGAAFAFRKVTEALWLKRLFGASFAASSVVTPFFLGTVAGGVATGRVPPGNAQGDLFTSWLNPTSLLGGTLAVGVCAYLAAVFLVRDAEREGHPDLVEAFRARALGTGIALGVIALGGIFVLRSDAPRLFDGLTGRALPLVVASAIFGGVSLLLLVRRRFVAVRITAALAVVAIVWGWAAGQYPYLLEPGLTIEQAASESSVLSAVLISLGFGAILLVPSMTWMFVLFQRSHHENPPMANGAVSLRHLDRGRR